MCGEHSQIIGPFWRGSFVCALPASRPSGILFHCTTEGRGIHAYYTNRYVRARSLNSANHHHCAFVVLVVSEAGWGHLKSPTANATALLQHKIDSRPCPYATSVHKTLTFRAWTRWYSSRIILYPINDEYSPHVVTFSCIPQLVYFGPFATCGVQAASCVCHVQRNRAGMFVIFLFKVMWQRDLQWNIYAVSVRTTSSPIYNCCERAIVGLLQTLKDQSVSRNRQA